MHEERKLGSWTKNKFKNRLPPFSVPLLISWFQETLLCRGGDVTHEYTCQRQMLLGFFFLTLSDKKFG
jgi:hypothetical protein